tara:strand:- start:335 stop:808 length:474 start_codon:yes stop_codon:yes gene_type:complete
MAAPIYQPMGDQESMSSFCESAISCSDGREDQWGCTVEEKTVETNEKAVSGIFDSFLFQGFLVYCLCIYFGRISEGFRTIWINIDVIFNLFICMIKCFAYIVILFMTGVIILGAISNEEKEIDVLKVMALVSFFDFLERRYDDEEERDERQFHWRRR